MKSCKKRGCKKTHYIKPEMSSVFKWKQNPDGTLEELPKPVYYVNDPDRVFPDRDWPLDYENYELRKKPVK